MSRSYQTYHRFRDQDETDRPASDREIMALFVKEDEHGLDLVAQSRKAQRQGWGEKDSRALIRKSVVREAIKASKAKIVELEARINNI